MSAPLSHATSANSWRFLGAADRERRAGSGGGAEALELGATELARGRHLAAAAGALERAEIERHRVLARADQDVARPVGHSLSPFLV